MICRPHTKKYPANILSKFPSNISRYCTHSTLGLETPQSLAVDIFFFGGQNSRFPVAMLPWLRAPGMSHFKAQHARRVAKLTEKLHEALVAEDDGEYLARTGSLVRSKTLRSKKTREAFSVILTAGDADGQENDQGCTEKRFWTKSLVQHALQKLVQDYRIEIPQLPGFTWPDWFKSQTKIVHGLCKKAFRNRQSMSGGSMDNLETLEYDPKDRVSSCKLHCEILFNTKSTVFPLHVHKHFFGIFVFDHQCGESQFF